ncbi:Glycosyl hydrolases family 43 [Pirellulimonas nuda]|uniref:Glycosyl hydrolases family 43 n=1 Tax=Pirellulimonas nuda TaxID=2528009 RepID=A0A518DIF6_9BACT|nr:family 43 glycosylhydrolase [Pirellulimonas nuda]QDU91263.1 Glycosyl hydrolases family 43 [Pirellulimonas nuda]
MYTRRKPRPLPLLRFAWSTLAIGLATTLPTFPARGATGQQPTPDNGPAPSGVHFSGVPLARPAHDLSAAAERLYEAWNPLGDFDNEFYTLFKYSRLGGIGKDAAVSRRDPSKVIRVGGKYYVYYTRRKTALPPVGLSNYTDATPDDVPAWDWDLADIYYATSTDGFDWQEQGAAVKRSRQAGYADRSLSTPDILCFGGKYYLYFQAFTGRFSQAAGDRSDVGMAWADSPDGPWRMIGRPVIKPGPSGAWDASAIHDPYPIVYNGQIWMYYKSDVWLEDPRGAPVESLVDAEPRAGRDIHRMHGVAIADAPEGPFRKSPLNPISNSGHETTLFPYRAGVASIIIRDGPERNTIQYAPDGLNFQIVAHVERPPVAGGPYCADAFTDSGDGRGVAWGLSHIVGSGNGFLVRFDCDLHRDIDHPYLKRGSVTPDESLHFESHGTLPQSLRKQYSREALSGS